MSYYYKKMLPLLLILMVVIIIPQAFASDLDGNIATASDVAIDSQDNVVVDNDNQLCSSNLKSGYDYETTVSPDSVDYVKGESLNVTVTANYETDEDIEGYSSFKAYVNDDTEGMVIDEDASSKNFTYDLAKISDKFADGKNTFATFNYNPLTVNVGQTEEPVIEAIYVSVDGDDSNDGTKDFPVASIAKAIDLVKTTGITTVYVSQGKYKESAIVIHDSLDIRGIGDVIIDAEKTDRIFFIYGAIEVSLSNLTLINGLAPTDGVTEDIHEVVYYAGGGAITIQDDAYVSMDNMTFINNEANEFGGAINVEAPLCIINNSIFINNTAGVFGGAIDFEDANCSVNNCLFMGNDATNGGAIGWIGDNANLTNSYFERNTAETGAALFIENTYNSDGNLVENNTFINNMAIEQGGAIEVENENMDGYGGYTVVRNNEFINNSAYNGGAISGYYGDVASVNNLFIGNTAGYGGAIATISAKSYLSSIGKLFLRNNTIINCTAEENGNGIFTMGYIDSKINITFMEGKTVYIPDGKAVVLNVTVCDDMGNPISGSPLDFTVDGKATINPASDLVEGFGDVRFVPRMNGTLTVSGIYGTEWDMLNYYNVVTGTLIVENAIEDYFGTIYVSDADGDDDNTGSEESPVKTFTEGYLLAAREGGSYNIIVKEGTYYVPGYTLEKSFNITGIGNPTLDGRNEGTLFSLYGGPKDEFHFVGLNFVNGVAKASTSGMYDGGVIFFKGGSLFLENDTFSKSSASDYGGAVYINKGLDMNSGYMYKAYAYITNCTFNSNYAKYDGGAIALYESDVYVTDCQFNLNSAKYGGAISILSGLGNLIVANSTFNKNSAIEIGGALEVEALNTYNTRYYVDVINSTFTDNSAKIGGAIVGQDANVTGCVFIGNKATDLGGAIAFGDKESVISKSVFEDNKANKGSAYCGNSTLVDGNYWGSEITSSKDLVDNGIININASDKCPTNWYDSIENMKDGILSDDTPKTNGSEIINDTNETTNITGNTTGNDTDNTTNSTTGNDTPTAEVTKIKTKLKISNKSFTITKTKKLTATLKDEKGNAVANAFLTFKVNGKEYYGKTNAKGVATVTVTLKKAKTFKYKVTFDGKDNYDVSSASANVKVLKEKSVMKITKKASYKAKAKTKTVKVTLKSASKKAIKKVKVTLKIKGKTYKAKTTAKGVAIFKIKVTKKGTYKTKVKFAGSSYYKAITKTIKIKIK